MRALSVMLAACLLVFTCPLLAQAIDPLPFKDHAEEVRFQQLTRELRCLVCQNENLADSNADLARDLRHEVFDQMQAGKSDAQIKQYLVDRYSDFVLYDPETTAIPRELLTSSLREHDQCAPVLVLVDEEVGPLIAAQLQQRRN